MDVRPTIERETFASFSRIISLARSRRYNGMHVNPRITVKMRAYACTIDVISGVPILWVNHVPMHANALMAVSVRGSLDASASSISRIDTDFYLWQKYLISDH